MIRFLKPFGLLTLLLLMSPLALSQSISLTPNPSTINPPANSTTVNVDFANPNNDIFGCTIIIDYDDTILDVSNCTNNGGTAIESCTDNNPNNGQLNVTFGEINTPVPGQTGIATITFQETGAGLAPGEESVLDILEANLNTDCVDMIGGSITTTFNDGAVDKAPASVTVTANDPDADEGGGIGQFTITSDQAAPTGGMVVQCSVSGSATSGTDYTAISCPVTIPATQTSTTVTVTPIEDLDVEGTETVVLTIDNDTNNPNVYTPGNPSSATVNIDDNDTLPVITVTATDPDADETGGTGEFTVSSDQAAPVGGLQVECNIGGTATSGTDYTAINCPVTIPDGQTSTTVAVTPIDDGDVEGDETVILTLVGDTVYTVGNPNSATVTIADDEPNPVLDGLTFNLTGPIGQSATATATLTNNGGSDVTGITITPDPNPPFAEESTTCTDTLAPGASCQIVLSCVPTANPQTGTLTITSNAPTIVAALSCSALVTTPPGDPNIPQAIPTLTEWGMMIMAGLMALFMLYNNRRWN